MEDRSHRDDLRVHGVPENAETMHALAFLSDAIPLWFPNLGSVEIMRAHRVGAPKEDTNGRPVPCTIIFKLLRFTDRDKILKAASGVGGKDHPLHPGLQPAHIQTQAGLL